jgi:serine/threonine protein kinase
MEKYEWSEQDAKAFSNFLLPMLRADPAKRASATECLKDPWLTLEPVTDREDTPVSSSFFHFKGTKCP